MKLVFHGGECCGIKTIYDFGFGKNSPNDLEEAVEERPEVSHDQHADTVNSDLEFFTDAAPEETRKKRLDRLIAFCERERPRGIIEINLSDGKAYSHWQNYEGYNQVRTWKNLLHKRKFKIVNKCKNSNTGNTVYVFHRNSGE